MCGRTSRVYSAYATCMMVHESTPRSPTTCSVVYHDVAQGVTYVRGQSSFSRDWQLRCSSTFNPERKYISILKPTSLIDARIETWLSALVFSNK